MELKGSGVAVLLERAEVETFLALAEELHFGRVAERLGLTTGRVSQTIKKLERRIGAPLFERTTRQGRHDPARPRTGHRLGAVGGRHG
ncbi:helix-turn-helix domain-containing protein [Streptomyces actinomycinicus]|uniref:helix-turn-helix domain-containing protein n=1 Tax=Streptomyces actinomycinicus TaxID=1695166 RepID=UPI0027DA56C6|nr:LysR family transcriptional regulator [Streptomyces actinomycinicus]